MELEKLELATIDGKTYSSLQEDVMRVTRWSINHWYNDYPVLKLYNCDKEQIEFDVYNGIYNRKEENGFNNLEKHYIKAIDNDFSSSYILNVVKRTVLLTLKCRSRDIAKKPLCDSLDRDIELSDNSVTLGDIVADKSTSIESQVELKLMLESIPNKVYSDYYYIDCFNKKKKLTTKKVLDYILSGYKITDMRQKVYDFKNDSNIKFNLMSRIHHEVIQTVKDSLGGYYE